MVVAQSEVFLRSAVTDDDVALEGEMRIGREKDCEIRIDDIHISRYHARITVADGQVLLEDLGSTNGTYVNVPASRGHMRLASVTNCAFTTVCFAW